MANPNRREVILAVGAVCAGALCPNCFVSAAGAADAAEPVKVGALKDFSAGGIFGKWAESSGFFVVRREGKLYAVSSRCSHKSSVLLKEENGSFRCPKHKALFAPTGALVKRGEAKRPLPRLGIRVDDQGQVTVHPSQRFDQSKWEEPGSFIGL